MDDDDGVVVCGSHGFDESSAIVPGAEIFPVACVAFYCDIFFPRIGCYEYDGGVGFLGSGCALVCCVGC